MTNAEARFNKSHIRKVYACLAVTYHLHFWQNDRDFLRATVVTRGWNGYRNKSQHRKSTLEKKILPPFQQGFEPATFQSRVRRSNHWAIPAPTKFNCIHLNLYSLQKSTKLVDRVERKVTTNLKLGQNRNGRSTEEADLYYVLCSLWHYILYRKILGLLIVWNKRSQQIQN